MVEEASGNPTGSLYVRKPRDGTIKVIFTWIRALSPLISSVCYVGGLVHPKPIVSMREISLCGITLRCEPAAPVEP